MRALLQQQSDRVIDRFSQEQLNPLYGNRPCLTSHLIAAAEPAPRLAPTVIDFAVMVSAV
jgi:hypothetical protein